LGKARGEGGAWAKVADGVYVVTVTVFDKDEDRQRAADEDADLVSPTNRVSIPTAFYRIILHQRPAMWSRIVEALYRAL